MKILLLVGSLRRVGVLATGKVEEILVVGPVR